MSHLHVHGHYTVSEKKEDMVCLKAVPGKDCCGVPCVELHGVSSETAEQFEVGCEYALCLDHLDEHKKD